jgi:hypothetical protein
MYTFNYIVMYVLIVFAYVSIAHRSDLGASRLGKVASLLIFGFWILRALEELTFFGIVGATSWVLIAICLMIGLIYLTPLVNSPQDRLIPGRS